MADRLFSDHTLFTLKGGCGTNKKLYEYHYINDIHNH